MSSAVNPSPRSDHDPATTSPNRSRDTRDVLAEQRDRFGGMKFGACFFGWLTATGTAVLLTALVAAVGAGFGLGRDLTLDPTGASAQTVGLVGSIVLLVIILVAYFAGGYVAGRMARFNGLTQGVGVWLWAIVAAVVFAILSLIAGARFNLLGALNSFQVPLNAGTLTTAGIVSAIVLVVAALVGAILGGLAGMRFHRRVDRATHG